MEAGTKQRSKSAEPRSKKMSKRVQALSHPQRATILHILVSRGPMSPSERTREIERVGGTELTKKERSRLLSRVSYHCERLCKLDCAELVRTRPVRGAVEHFYRATERPLVDTEEWDQLDPITAEDLVSGYIQEIVDDFVESRRARLVGFDPQFHITRTAYCLDDDGIQEGMEVYEEARLAMIEVQMRSAERMASSAKKPVPVTSSFVFFKVPPDRIAGSSPAPSGAAPPRDGGQRQIAGH